MYRVDHDVILHNKDIRLFLEICAQVPINITQNFYINTHPQPKAQSVSPLQSTSNQQWVCSQSLKINSPNPPPLTTFLLHHLQSPSALAQSSVTASNEVSIWDRGSLSSSGSALKLLKGLNLRAKVTMMSLVGRTQRGF